MPPCRFLGYFSCLVFSELRSVVCYLSLIWGRFQPLLPEIFLFRLLFSLSYCSHGHVTALRLAQFRMASSPSPSLCHTHGIQTFLGQGLNPCHCSDPSCCSDNARSLSCCITREFLFSVCFILFLWISTWVVSIAAFSKLANSFLGHVQSSDASIRGILHFRYRVSNI